jgi:hypothetical protein
MKHSDGKLITISGEIKSYKSTRANASFVFSDSDRTTLGVVAVAAGLAGLSGQAISTASNAADTEEAADYLELSIDDRAVKGWVWRSPFRSGDLVDVVGTWAGDHFELVAIRRASDRTIALYPHCSRGRLRHFKKVAFWWAVGTNFFAGGISLMILNMTGLDVFLTSLGDGVGYMFLGIYIFFAIAALSMSRQWMPLVRLAEKVFRALEISGPSNVDLVKSSRRLRTPNDPGEFGTFYFRY